MSELYDSWMYTTNHEDWWLDNLQVDSTHDPCDLLEQAELDVLEDGQELNAHDINTALMFYI